MNNNLTFEVDMNKMYENKLSFEAYLILYSVASKNKDLVSSYVKNIKPISTEVFKNLEKDGYITFKESADGKIYYELISLSTKGQSFFGTGTFDVEKQFGEFRTFYPMIVTNGVTSRRLQGNLKRCKKLYEELLMETTHDILCKTAALYYEEKLKSNSQMYMQNLETWLNQRNYQQYLTDLDKQLETKVNFTDDI
jgi:hypothetical protein